MCSAGTHLHLTFTPEALVLFVLFGIFKQKLAFVYLVYLGLAPAVCLGRDLSGYYPSVITFRQLEILYECLSQTVWPPKMGLCSAVNSTW